MVVLGIDAGGTKTVCHLADEHARTIVETRGPGANLQAPGELEVEKVLHQVISQALAGSGASPTTICLGMAGVDRPRDAEVVRGILVRIGQRAQPFVVNDALIALEAGVPGGAGIVVVAGTGSIAYGRDAAGRAARAGGWGALLARSRYLFMKLHRARFGDRTLAELRGVMDEAGNAPFWDALAVSDAAQVTNGRPEPKPGGFAHKCWASNNFGGVLSEKIEGPPRALKFQTVDTPDAKVWLTIVEGAGHTITA